MAARLPADRGTAMPGGVRGMRALEIPIALVGAVAVLTTFVLCVADPTGSAGVYRVVILVSLSVMLIGPWIRGAGPWYVWLPQACGVLGFVAILVVERFAGPAHPLYSFRDVLCVAAYLCLAFWLALLSRAPGQRSTQPRTRWLDGAGLALGVVLVFWCITLAPMMAGRGISRTFLWLLYPVFDLVLLVLVCHVVLSWRRILAPIGWLIGGLVLLNVVDGARAFQEILIGPGASQRSGSSAGYVLAYFAMACAAVHPRLRELDPDRSAIDAPGYARLPSAMMIMTITPIVVAMVLPPVGVRDVVVRVVLTIVITIVLFTRLILTMRALRDAEEVSHHRATHDPLTGLLNRGAVVDRLTGILRERRPDGRVAVLLLDCDDFKSVNDTWGHDAGDAMLITIARRLRQEFGPSAICARQGGDEFVVVLAGDGARGANEVGERALRCFAEPLEVVRERRHRLTASIGVAMIGSEPGIDAETALNHADLAMYEAKRQGCARIVEFDDQLRTRLRQQKTIGDRLAMAVEQDALRVVLQPIIAGPPYVDIRGWEALARWEDPVLGRVSPDQFIPIAEQLGLMPRLGENILRRACEALARLTEAYPELDPGVSVNVSVGQLREPGLVETVHRVVHETGVDPELLMLEVTESMMVDEGTDAFDTLRRLQEMGATIAVDDYGSGYAALPTLMRMPLGFVKIDKSFTDRLLTDPRGRRQMSALLSLVRSVSSCSIIVEGIETPEQEAALAELGCRAVQGWLYGRPEPVERWIAYEGRWPWVTETTSPAR